MSDAFVISQRDYYRKHLGTFYSHYPEIRGLYHYYQAICTERGLP